MNRRIEVLGCEVDPIGLHEAVDQVARWVEGGSPHRGIALNLHKVALAKEHPAVRSELQTAHLVVADGVSITLAARLGGRPLPGRLTGVDLLSALLRRGDHAGWRIALLGGRPEVAQALAGPNRWTHHGYFGAVPPVDAIRDFAPQLLFVGLGSPDQEAFLHRHGGLGAAFAMGVGGSLDVLAGAAPRAPRLLRRAGLEGVWRVARDPVHRLPRLLRDLAVLGRS